MTTPSRQLADRLAELGRCLDEPAGRYEELRGVRGFGDYIARPAVRSDEETLTEPILAAILERVLGFPADAYFPQLGHGGVKPDFTPIDLIAHSFVLDAKASDQALPPHEAQIRRYISQRSLDYGVLFNLREVRVYQRGRHGHDRALSFALLPVWQAARGEALPATDVAAFALFCERFAHRRMGLADKIAYIREQESWSARVRAGEPLAVDVEFLTDRLRSLSRLLLDDAAAQQDRLDRVLRLNPGREPALLRELEALALDIAPGTAAGDLPTDLAGWRAGGLPERVWRQYLLRVAYLALTRILLYRAWEDAEFVEDYLYDGGFGIAYDRLSASVQAVLREAFLHGADRYPWLYGAGNNYDWYRPRDAALVEVLYSLAPVPLGRLDADVLGDLYAAYVDEIDRDRLGQFYTPREVVGFMLDRAGFSGAQGVFRIEGDQRRPRRVFDFATGSGGFLVEAARRIIDEGGVADDDARGLEEALVAIVSGLVGGEISPFPYYLTEVNLLLQVSRLLGRLALAGESPATFTLGVLHVDSLLARDAADRSLDSMDADLRADRGGITADERFGLVPLDGDKRDAFRALREEGDFDLVVGNPPYVAEAGNRPLFDRLRAIPAWRGTYRGKTDYLYYFLLLAAEKVRPGGRLCVITPAGWMNAGAADFLRERLAADLRLDELFLFGGYRLFAPPRGRDARRGVPIPTVESAILLATKVPARRNHSLRVVALEDQEAAAGALARDPEARTPDRDRLLAEMARRAGGRTGRRNGIHSFRLRQHELAAERPWPIKHSAMDLPTRVVAYLQAALEHEGVPVEPLAEGWHVFQGIQTGADAYSRRIQRRLTPEQVRTLAAAGAQLGDPILELPAGREHEPPWVEHPELLAAAPEPQAILYGAVDGGDYGSLIVLGNDPPPARVLAALERWRPILESRADIVANAGRKPWWAAHRSRSQQLLVSPKVFALYRTDRGRFALDEEGAWQPSIKATLAVGRRPDAPAAYLCGLLNSELLDIWYAVRGKTPRDVWRNYEPRRMNEMPYRRPEGDPRADEVAGLVRLIAANRRALLPHRAAFPGLTATVKDPWRADPPAADPAAAIEALAAAETVSLRLDARLSLTSRELSGRPRRLDPATLGFRRGRVETGRVSGDPVLLDLVEAAVGRSTDDAGATLLPKDLHRFEAGLRERRGEVARLLHQGRRVVEEVERLVCGLYGVPASMTDEVVLHADRRAARRAGSDPAPG